MRKIPAARYVKERLRLTKGVGAMAVMERMQEYLESKFALNDDAFTFLRLTALGELGWLAEIVWDHHDGNIVEFKAIHKRAWRVVYQVCAEYLEHEERMNSTELERADKIHVISFEKV